MVDKKTKMHSTNMLLVDSIELTASIMFYNSADIVDQLHTICKQLKKCPNFFKDNTYSEIIAFFNKHLINHKKIILNKSDNPIKNFAVKLDNLEKNTKELTTLIAALLNDFREMQRNCTYTTLSFSNKVTYDLTLLRKLLGCVKDMELLVFKLKQGSDFTPKNVS